MIEALTSFLQVLLFSSTLVGASAAGSAPMWALVLAAVVVIVLLRAAGSPRSIRASLARPARAIGVSATVAALVPQQQSEREIAVVDTGSLGLSNTWPLWRVIWRGWSRPPSGNARVWHARRDVEMLLGLFLKHVLRQNWKLVFRSLILSTI